MRGEVEIWSGDELVSKESNLVVDGAGATIADFMTLSPSISGTTLAVPGSRQYPTASAILDASNYRVQAMSFGKDASAYHLNAHSLSTRRNLITYSTPSAAVTAGGSNSGFTLNRDCSGISRTDISPPPAYATVPSGEAHVIEVSEKNSSGNSYLSYSRTVNSTGAVFGTSAFDDLWMCFSVYVKSPASLGDMEPTPVTETLSGWRSHFGWNLRGHGYDGVSDQGGHGFSRLGTVVEWDSSPSSGFSSPSAIQLSYQPTDNSTTAVDRAVSAGYSIENWGQNGGCTHEGNGWYRVWTAGLSPVSATSGMSVTMYPVSFESSPTGETEGGIFTYGYQIESGRWPTALQFNHGYEATNWDFSGNVLNKGKTGEITADKGTVRVVATKDAAGVNTSAYVPDNWLSSPPNPESTRLEDFNTSLFDTSCDVVSGLNLGQNLNVVPYREQVNNDPTQTLNCFSSLVDHSTDYLKFLRNYSAAYPPSAMGTIGPQAYYLGCFPEGSSTGGSNFAFVSSLENSAAYASTGSVYSGTYNSIVNEASSMDVSGFLNMIMSSSPNYEDTTTNDELLMSSTYSGLCMSGSWATDPDGFVEYTTTIGAGDVGYSNLYGGIYNLGLWTIDMKETLKARNVPPYSFGPLNNPRKYKLFATKHLTQNLGYVNDRSASQPGAGAYKDITIKWRIYFT
jgi:hypothetical protein